MTTPRKPAPSRYRALVLALLAAGLVAFWLLVGRGSAPTDLGTPDGRLEPCPETPNCVSTQADPNDTGHYMRPITFTGTTSEATEAIARTVEESPRARITRRSDGYVRAEFTSLVFRFIDDVEFSVDDEAKLIHFRSASRLGAADMGVNRARMTKLKETLRKELR